MAEMVGRLIDDHGARRALGERARQRVERDFGWGQIGRRQAELYRALIDQ
jgi:glycosyltransferase involved in cell wall biosynthesis